MQHRFRESRCLGRVQSAQPRGHQPRGHLIIGNFPTRVGRDEVVNLFAGMFSGVAFFSYEVDGTHAFEKKAEPNIGNKERQRSGPLSELALRSFFFFVARSLVADVFFAEIFLFKLPAALPPVMRIAVG
jgi:hypothetical protein